MLNTQFFINGMKRAFQHPAMTVGLVTAGSLGAELSYQDKSHPVKTMFPGNTAYAPVLGPLAGSFIHMTKSLPPAHAVTLLLLTSSAFATLAYGLASTFGPEAYKKPKEETESKINKP